MKSLAWITKETARTVQERFGTPTFLYCERLLLEQAQAALAFPNPFGLTVRYAMKACPNAAVVRLLSQAGLALDASSGFEAWRAIRAGVDPGHIQITTQELPEDLDELLQRGVLFNASSLHQLDRYGTLRPGDTVSIRINPGLGSGHSNRTNVGGPAASFGIWHEYLPQVLKLAAKHHLRITGLHSHIGSGSDPAVWQRCAGLSLAIAARLPEVERVNLGGGFKVGRLPDEPSTDLQAAGAPVAAELERFARERGRQLHLEIEPGTFLVANAGALICAVTDVVDTGARGYRFVKVNTGMTEILRPSLYGAQHPIELIPLDTEARIVTEYVVVGHCCESGDLLTPGPGDPESLAPRLLTEARIGDLLLIGGCGAYCAAMPAKNYNSFPEAAEVLQDCHGRLQLVRHRQRLDQITANEILPDILH